MNEIEEIKNRLDIIDVISDYVKLDKAGTNYRGLCPFHKEKTPSFMVSQPKQIYHCFGCASGGDMFEFIKQIEGVEFYDALRILARKAGVELKMNKEWAQEKTERQKILEVLEQATKFFEYYLENSSNGKKAKEYLKHRGFKDETIKEWRIGYAPATYEALCKFLEERGYSKKYIEKAGLGFLKANGNLCDRFRSRIIFPFFNINSEIVGFTGRIFGEVGDVAKYLNTPATEVYDKSKILFGLHKAKLPIRENDKCIFVEGNVDAVLSSQAGVKNVVAVSGTALTELHLTIMSRYTKNLVFCFDMDLAGKKATKRAIDLALKLGFNIGVVVLEEGKDPADIILEKGEEEWQKVILKEIPIMDYYFKTAFEGRDIKSVKDKKAISSELVPEIKRINNNIEQAHFIQLLADRLKVREDDIRAELSKVKEEKLEIDEKRVAHKEENQKDKIQKKFLKLFLIQKIPIEERLFTERYVNIFRELESKKIEDIIEDKKLLAEIVLGVEKEKEILKENEVTIEHELENCIHQLNKIFFEEDKRKLSLEIKNEKDLDKKNKLLVEYNNIINNYGNKEAN
jgi:DNA primase